MFKKIVAILAILSCCTPPQQRNNLPHTSVKYAKNFDIQEKNGHTYLLVKPPGNTREPVKYSLDELPKTFVCTSTTHLPFFELLNAEEAVVGFPNLNYISSKSFIERAKRGLLADLGPDESMNLEILIGLDPDAIIAFGIAEQTNSLNKIKESGIPIYYNSDFLEESPLGRAEWIKFFGVLLGKTEMADSIFNEIEKDYKLLKLIVSRIKTRPSILSGVVYGDTWFLPGGNNWSANFFEDAGGKYLWDDNPSSEWLELSFESVYEQANGADFWIGTSTLNSREELIDQDPRYSSFKAFEEDQVYSYNKMVGPNGGYDIFESGFARPDLVLSDLIKIIHPELLPDYETVYFQKLP